MTDKQLEILTDFGYDTNVLTDEECKETLDALQSNKWQPLPGGPPKLAKDKSGLYASTKPASPKQVAILKDYGFDTDGMTLGVAAGLIDQCRTDNGKGWKDKEAVAHLINADVELV